MADTVREKYSKDHIGEVFCQITFDVPASWTPAAYGVLLDKVRDLGFQTPRDMGFMLQPATTVDVAPILVRYVNADETALLQLSPFLFSVNHLTPYPGWENFKPLVLEAVSRCVSAVEPTLFRQFGLRYINRLRIPTGENLENSILPLANWLNIHPTVPEVRKPYHGFGLQCQWLVEADHTLTVSVSRDQTVLADEAVFILDLGYMVNVLPDWNLSQLPDLLEKSHDAIYALFEECITENTRCLLKEVKPHE